MKKKIIIFSGAGLSAESGISTFRQQGGLWEQYRIEDVATPEAWARDADLVSHFYNERRKQIVEVLPNKAHELIFKLEEEFDVQVITQNIDDLHERAGSQNILHLHGHILYAKSSGPQQEILYRIEGWELKESDRCPAGYRLRPHVVWFGEEVPMMTQAQESISQAEILLVLGTSLQVYPAAALIHHAQAHCKKFIIDPGAYEMNLPKDFIKIALSASEGLVKFRELLSEITF